MAESATTGPMEAHFVRGEHTLAVPMSLFRENRERLISRLRSNPNVPSTGAFVVLRGGVEIPFNDTDISWPFRQESYFQWCFGVEEPDCFGSIDLSSGESILFVPRLPAEYAVWQGHLYTPAEFEKRYAVDKVHYTDEIANALSDRDASIIFTLHGTNSDSGLVACGADFKKMGQFTVNNELLYSEIAECRVIKSPKEIEVLRYVVKVSSDAHRAVMRAVRPGFTEFQAEAIFQQYVYAVGGCRHVSYTCICGSGHNASVLHYGHAGAPNNRVLKDGDICLFDMGGNYCGYAADITCSFPANGVFTNDQKMIYNAVLDARTAVLNVARPGVSWSDMHLLANRVVLSGLIKGGILRGDVDQMIRAGLGEVFQPHGLGHLLGLDVHDVGGYLPGHPVRSTEPGLRKLRTARILRAGMVLTIEPGCYFINCKLDEALADPNQAQYIVEAELMRFRNWGGVRIEDDVLITETGAENLTDVPRTTEEIEAWMAGSRNCKLPQEHKFAAE